FQERERTAPRSAAAQLFPGRPYRRKIGPGSAAVLKKHRLAHGQSHDVFHRVVHVLNETGAALRILVLRPRALGLSGLAIVKIISRARVLAHAVLMIQTGVEPNRLI